MQQEPVTIIATRLIRYTHLLDLRASCYAAIEARLGLRRIFPEIGTMDFQPDTFRTLPVRNQLRLRQYSPHDSPNRPAPSTPLSARSQSAACIPP